MTIKLLTRQDANKIYNSVASFNEDEERNLELIIEYIRQRAEKGKTDGKWIIFDKDGTPLDPHFSIDFVVRQLNSLGYSTSLSDRWLIIDWS